MPRGSNKILQIACASLTRKRLLFSGGSRRSYPSPNHPHKSHDRVQSIIISHATLHEVYRHYLRVSSGVSTISLSPRYVDKGQEESVSFLFYSLRAGKLCWHNFEHNSYFLDNATIISVTSKNPTT